MSTGTDVIVVGAGPTGLTAAVALRCLGHAVTVIDPDEDKGLGSKALTIHAGTLAVLDRLGCSEQVLAEGIRMRGLRLRTRRSVLLDQRMDLLPGDHPFALTLPQPRTEAILRNRANELGAEFVVGALHDLDQQGSTVCVALRDGRTSTARYVVGADGKRSATREALGVAFPDTGANRGDEKAIVLADVAFTGEFDLEHVSGFPGPRGLLMLMPMGPGHARLAASVDTNQTIESREDFQGLLDQRGPRGISVDEVSWVSRFQFSHHLAETFHRGRVLLAGDAAHVHSPVGGQGMNLGIRDAYYAAAAIDGAIATGETTPLESYAANRRAAASEVIAVTNKMSRMLFAPPPIHPLRNLVLRLMSRSPLAARQALGLSGLLDTGPDWQPAEPTHARPGGETAAAITH